jgi:hypothetical protein
VFKLAYAFKHTADRVAGWTENFFVNVDTVDLAEETARSFGPLLLAIHGDQTIMSKCRISDPDGKVPGTLVRYGKQKVKALKEDSCSDFPTTSVTLELKGTDGRTTRQWIKGLREDAIMHGGFMALEGDFAAAFAKVESFLTAKDNKMCQRVFDDSFGGDDIIGLSTGGIVLSPAHGLTAKTFVKITGVEQPKYANRVWKAIPIDLNTFQLYKYKLQAFSVTNGPGQWQVDAHKAQEIKTAVLIYASKRDVGRPSDVLGGRRTKK